MLQFRGLPLSSSTLNAGIQEGDGTWRKGTNFTCVLANLNVCNLWQHFAQDLPSLPVTFVLERSTSRTIGHFKIAEMSPDTLVLERSKALMLAMFDSLQIPKDLGVLQV